MATSVIVPALLAVKEGRNFQERIFNLQVGAGNYASPLPLDFTAATNPNLQPGALAWEPGAVVGYAVNNGPVDYAFELIEGEALNSWGLRISTAGVELTAGNPTPAAITGATDILIAVDTKTNKSV